MSLMGYYEFMPSSELLNLVGQAYCNEQDMTVDMCVNVLFLVGGYDSGQLNRVSVKLQCSLWNIQLQLADKEMIPAEWACLVQCAVRSVLTIGGNRGLLLVVVQ
jgi:hypothetical protein